MAKTPMKKPAISIAKKRGGIPEKKGEGMPKKTGESILSFMKRRNKKRYGR